MRYLLLVALLACGCSSRPPAPPPPTATPTRAASASPTATPTPPAHVELEQLSQHQGQRVVVRVHVTSVVVSSSGNVFFNLRPDYKQNPASIVCFPNERARFTQPKLEDCQGKDVEITSEVKMFEGKPQLQLYQPGQLKIL